jgi:hypothetical protein
MSYGVIKRTETYFVKANDILGFIATKFRIARFKNIPLNIRDKGQHLRAIIETYALSENLRHFDPDF